MKQAACVLQRVKRGSEFYGPTALGLLRDQCSQGPGDRQGDGSGCCLRRRQGADCSRRAVGKRRGADHWPGPSTPGAMAGDEEKPCARGQGCGSRQWRQEQRWACRWRCMGGLGRRLADNACADSGRDSQLAPLGSSDARPAAWSCCKRTSSRDPRAARAGPSRYLSMHPGLAMECGWPGPGQRRPLDSAKQSLLLQVRMGGEENPRSHVANLGSTGNLKRNALLSVHSAVNWAGRISAH